MKTNVTILQEMMVKMGMTVDYQYTPQTGPPHAAVFTCHARALGAAAAGSARSKREAKQEAAGQLLAALAERLAEAAPAPALPPPERAPPPDEPEVRTHVALLRELCEEYGLGDVEYSLLADTGPAHARQFTIRAALGGSRRDATACSKKLARQRAAHALYETLRALLPARTAGFSEKEALERAHERAMERYTAARGAAESLTLRVSDWGGALRAAAGAAAARARALAANDRLDEALELLELRPEVSEWPPLWVASAAGAPAPLVAGGRDAGEARAALAAVLVQLLRPAPGGADRRVEMD